jgi:hypothetical protein
MNEMGEGIIGKEEKEDRVAQCELANKSFIVC